MYWGSVSRLVRNEAVALDIERMYGSCGLLI